MNKFFDDLGRRFTSTAATQGTEIQAPSLEPAVAEQLLELARVAAHTGERPFAPLACYMAGVAAERFRAAGGGDSGAIATLIERVRSELEAGAPPRS
ncbi:MAG: DUF6457 domain-containing protein [Candidatus Dormibacteraceae bacterium]